MLEKLYQLKFYGTTTQTNSPRDRQLNFAQKLLFFGDLQNEICTL